MKKFYKIKDSQDYKYLCFGLPKNADNIAMDLKSYEWHTINKKRSFILKAEGLVKMNILFMQLLEKGNYEI